ncbi:MAG: AraC family transcriptional regulator [Tannerella sp.]|nr:AraC family transcriptional regulator [Tannerella sp.]
MELILLNIGLAVHHADWNYKNVNSPFARIYLVTEGAAKLHLPECTYHLQPGHLYLIPPFTRHSYECDAFFSLYYIHIYEEPSPNRRILEDLIYPVELKATHTDCLQVKRLAQINPGRELKQYDPSAYDNTPQLMQNINLHGQNPLHIIMETKGILFQLLSRFLEHAKDKYTTTDTRIRKTIRYIRKNIEKRITMEELTSICFISKDHFIRLFKKEMQITPVQYIHQKKIERAQLMLTTSNQAIKDIAYSLSFDNVYYFNRVFKRITGITPSEYKNNL